MPFSPDCKTDEAFLKLSTSVIVLNVIQNYLIQ